MGLVADAFGLSAATLTIAGLTFASGLVVVVRMRETLRRDELAETAQSGSDCIEPEALAQILGVVVIDVRAPEEYAEAHVDGALNIPLDVLVERAADLAPDVRLVIACGEGGGRSERAVALLRDLGFSSVHSLCGGTAAWLGLHPLPRRGTV